MNKIIATNQETRETRTFKIGRRTAVITTSAGDRRETTPDAAREEAAKLEWPWVKS